MGVLVGTHQCASDAPAGWHLEQSANPVRAVSASPAVLSQTSHVFVSLSEPVVILVFCDMLHTHKKNLFDLGFFVVENRVFFETRKGG